MKLNQVHWKIVFQKLAKCRQKIPCGQTDESKRPVYRLILKPVVKVHEEKFSFLCFFQFTCDPPRWSPWSYLKQWRESNSYTSMRQTGRSVCSSVFNEDNDKCYYRPSTKYDGMLYFQFVCQSTPRRVPHRHPLILPLVSCPFWGLPHLHPLILPLVPCSLQGVFPVTGHRSFPRGYTILSWPGGTHVLAWGTLLARGYEWGTPGQDWCTPQPGLRYPPPAKLGRSTSPARTGAPTLPPRTGGLSCLKIVTTVKH